MKTYKVTQTCRCAFIPEATEANKNKMRKYSFTKDLNVGSYSEQDFLALTGPEFIKSGKFKEYCDIGWIKVIEEKDVTFKAVTQLNNKL